ncbi:MAG: methionine synthase [Bacillota bacterium]
MKKRIVGAAIGDCVHVAGVINFLRLAEDSGYETVFLGPAVPVDTFLKVVEQESPYMAAVGYRLSPETAKPLLERLSKGVRERKWTRLPLLTMGGTPPVARVAESLGIFDRVFSGLEDIDEVLGFLKGHSGRRENSKRPPSTLVERIEFKRPYPVIRHHFGLPDLDVTVRGVKTLASSGVLDVISLGPDQNAQESFFRPWEMDPSQDGAGGVPLRTPEDLRRLYGAAQCGNYPLLRCYSGTRDVFKMADLLLATIDNAWSAIPVFWYNVLDGRGPRNLEESIRDSQRLMAWHAARGVPVEVNDAHQWSLRDAHDVVAVVAAFLGAYNAKRAGVTTYVAQYMFNNPPATSPMMDLAKMMAKIEMIESLHDESFQSFREVRAGLASFPADMDMAKGQLAASTYLGMTLNPDIVHVVAHTEGDHAATPHDIIEACKIVRGVIRNCMAGLPSMIQDPVVLTRKQQLLEEAGVLLEAIRGLAPQGTADPWADPVTLGLAVRGGLMDAPHLKGNPVARGEVRTRMVNGTCCAVHPDTQKPLSERERIDLARRAAMVKGIPQVAAG